MAESKQRIVKITLDEHSVVRRNEDVEHERAVAIADLLDDNSFMPTASLSGPFHLHLGIADNRLLLDIRDTEEKALDRVVLPLSPFRKIVKEYFMICGSYYSVVRGHHPSSIEAIDMGRRALHNEGGELLRERLADRVAVDLNTARRLFTLLCVLHIRG